MAYIKIEANGISRFVEETNTSKIQKIREKFLAEVEVENTGRIKKYTGEEVAEYLGTKKATVDLYSLFNLKNPKITEKVEKTELTKKKLDK